MTQTISLPDFEDMYKRLESIKEVTAEKLLLEVQIKEREGDIVLLVTTDPTFFEGGKPPSMAKVSSSYIRNGVNGELTELRKRYAELSAELEYLKYRFDLDKIAIDVWRTQSANERRVVE